jgi:hypothetical protein
VFHKSLTSDPIDHVSQQPALGHTRPERADDQQWQVWSSRQPSDEPQAFGVRPMQVFDNENARTTLEQVADEIDSRAQALLAPNSDVSAGVAAQDRHHRPKQDPKCLLRVGKLGRNRRPRPDAPFDRLVQEVEGSAERSRLGVGGEYLVIGQGGDELAYQPTLADAGFAVQQDDARLGQPVGRALEAAQLASPADHDQAEAAADHRHVLQGSAQLPQAAVAFAGALRPRDGCGAWSRAAAFTWLL